jgi:hypothetical protein
MGKWLEFRGNTDQVLTHIKWCRANLGVLGVDWQFHGNYRKLEIKIHDPKIRTWYLLKFPQPQHQRP